MHIHNIFIFNLMLSNFRYYCSFVRMDRNKEIAFVLGIEMNEENNILIDN